MITRVCAYDTVFSLVKRRLGISLETSFRFFRLALFALPVQLGVFIFKAYGICNLLRI